MQQAGQSILGDVRGDVGKARDKGGEKRSRVPRCKRQERLYGE
jgi:hypothetical protein